MYTVEEMAKLEQEHKDRIANMTAQYTAAQEKASAKFDTQCAEALEVLKGLEAQRVDTLASVEALGQERKLAQASVDAVRREIEDLGAMQKDFIAGIERDTEAKRQALKKLQVEELQLTGALIKLREDITSVEAKNALQLEAYHGACRALVGNREATKIELQVLLAESENLTAAIAAKKAELAPLTDNNVHLVEQIAEQGSTTERLRFEISELDTTLAQRKKDLEETEGKLAENLAQFKDIDLAKADLAAKMLDARYHENQNAKRARELADKETKLAAMAAA